MFAAYTLDWFTVRGAVISDVAGKHQGTRGALDIERKYRPNDSLTLSAGPGITWDDGSYSRRFFGIDGEQSAIAVVPPYTAGSGINALLFAVGADFRIDRRWAWAESRPRPGCKAGSRPLQHARARSLLWRVLNA